MGKYMKKCKGMSNDQVAVMEVVNNQQIGVRTRAKTLAMAAATTTTSTIVTKKRKITTPSTTTTKNSSELHFSSSPFLHHQLRSRRKILSNSEKSSNSTLPNTSENSISVTCVIPSNNNSCSSPNSTDNVHEFPVSRCSSNGSTMLVNENFILPSSVIDLEGEGFEKIGNSTYSDCRERRETTPSSNLRAESGDLESTDRLITMENSHQRIKEKMAPSEAEIDEFFSVAEKDEQKRFADRYNFDIVKDLPMEGRYEWVRLT